MAETTARHRTYTPEEYKRLAKFDKLCTSLALVQDHGVHGAFFSLRQLGEDIQPLRIDASAAHRYALLSHIGKLVVECGIGFEDIELLGQLNGREGRRSLEREGASSRQENRNAFVTSTPRQSLVQLEEASLTELVMDDTFGEPASFRYDTPEPLSVPSSPPRTASAPPPTQSSFNIDQTRTVLATYALRPRSLNSCHSLHIDTQGGRKTISHPIPLQPFSPGDLDIPKVNSYPRPGLGHRLKTMASKMSLRSLKSAKCSQ